MSFPLFVPAGCTDLLQECDTLLNKPFKDGVRKPFRDHMASLFEAHLPLNLSAALFRPKLTMGALKPFVTSFVQRGIAEVSTPEMKIKIINVFANDGCFTEIRSPEMARIVQLEGQEILIVNQGILMANEVIEGDEKEVVDIGNISGSDGDSDSDSDEIH